MCNKTFENQTNYTYIGNNRMDKEEKKILLMLYLYLKSQMWHAWKNIVKKIVCEKNVVWNELKLEEDFYLLQGEWSKL